MMNNIYHSFSLEDLENKNLQLFSAISGSRAYGLATENSDTDIKGVFFLPYFDFLVSNPLKQVNDEKNNIVFYELGRFIELLFSNNPNILELLATPDDCVLYKSPLFDNINSKLFLSKQVKNTFANYAFSQIKKARGLNKKINQPIIQEEKTPMDFCYILTNNHSKPLSLWLLEKKLSHCDIALNKVSHCRSIYYVYLDNGQYGHLPLFSNSSPHIIEPHNNKPIAFLSFNIDAYSYYCKEYASYKQWEKERNPERWKITQEHSKNYDGKNMMHTFRLLETALDIAQYGEVIVRRKNRDELLAIKHGEFEYDYLLKKAEDLMVQIEMAFQKSSLPEYPDYQKIMQLLAHLRQEIYV